MRPSFSFAEAFPAFSARFWALALSVSRWLPRDILLMKTVLGCVVFEVHRNHKWTGDLRGRRHICDCIAWGHIFRARNKSMHYIRGTNCDAVTAREHGHQWHLMRQYHTMYLLFNYHEQKGEQPHGLEHRAYVTRKIQQRGHLASKTSCLRQLKDMIKAL